MHRIIHADNLSALSTIPSETIRLVYIDPPFNTGKKRVHTTLSMHRADTEDMQREGFGGHGYVTTKLGTRMYDDTFDDYIGFIEPRIQELRRVLTCDGSIFVHVDPRESHYVKIMLDRIFGRDCFMNEIIWAYDFGGRSKTRWPEKHDTIFWYTRDSKHYVFNQDAIDRIPYMAPGLVGPVKAARGKTPTDVWWHTIVPTGGREKTGYPTQKPLGILRRIIAVHSDP